MFNNKSILITGGTGSLGKALTKRILKSYPEVNRIIVFSRDEQKQFQMEQEFPKVKFPQMRFLIGMLEIMRDLKELWKELAL